MGGLAQGLAGTFTGRRLRAVPVDGAEFIEGGMDGVPEGFSGFLDSLALVEDVVLVCDCPCLAEWAYGSGGRLGGGVRVGRVVVCIELCVFVVLLCVFVCACLFFWLCRCVCVCSFFALCLLFVVFLNMGSRH